MNNQQSSIIPNTSHYWLKNTHVPICFVETDFEMPSQTREGLSLVDIEINQGVIRQILHSSVNQPLYTSGDIPTVNLKGGQVWPCFVDMHTHLDKGYTWVRCSCR